MLGRELAQVNESDGVGVRPTPKHQFTVEAWHRADDWTERMGIKYRLRAFLWIARHGLLVLLLPGAFTAPSPTPEREHHHHPNHGHPKLHAKPNGIQWVHRPPLTTGRTPLRSDAQSPVEHLHHECRCRKKRWYLDVSVNGRFAAVERLRIQPHCRPSFGSRAMGIVTPCAISDKVLSYIYSYRIGITRSGSLRGNGAWQ